MNYAAAIIHEIQIADRIHLSQTAREQIYRLVKEAEARAKVEPKKQRDEWKQKFFQKESAE